MIEEGPQGEQGERGERGPEGPEGPEGVIAQSDMDRLDAVGNSIESLRQTIADENKIRNDENIKRDERIATNRKAWQWMRRGVAVSILGIVLVGNWARISSNNANDAKQALVEYKRTIKAAQVGSCKQFNKQQQNQADAEKAEERERRAASSVSIQPILDLLNLSQAQYDALQAERIARFDATVDRAHPMRDCTRAGIDRYLRGLPPAMTKGK